MPRPAATAITRLNGLLIMATPMLLVVAVLNNIHRR